MLQVIEINSIDRLAPYRQAWAALLAETPLATFFQSLDWLEVYWRHHADDQRLRVLIVCDANRPVGIVPLVVQREINRLGAFRVLVYPLNEWGTFFGPIGGDPRQILCAAFEHLRDTPRDWDIIDLRAIDDTRIEHGAIPEAFAQVGFAAKHTTWNQASILALDSTWNEYWATRRSHFRTNLRASERKIQSAHAVRFLRFRPQAATHDICDPRWDLFDDCQRVASRSWQSQSTTGTTLSHEACSGLLRDAHLAAARAGALDVALLYLDQRPAAFLYNYHYAGLVYGLRMGFDPQVSRGGTCNLLMQYTIQDSIERGDRLIDLGPGHEPYKRHWRTSVVPSDRFTHYAAHAPRAQTLRLKRSLETWLGGTSIEYGSNLATE